MSGKLITRLYGENCRGFALHTVSFISWLE